MELTYVSAVINVLLILAFIMDRIFRLKSIREFKEAKLAQIELLKQQVDQERKNNDIEITAMHKKRYESLKIILNDKETAINNYQIALLELQAALTSANKEADMKQKLSEQLLKELNKVERSKHELELEKKFLNEESEDLPKALIKSIHVAVPEDQQNNQRLEEIKYRS